MYAYKYNILYYKLCLSGHKICIDLAENSTNDYMQCKIKMYIIEGKGNSNIIYKGLHVCLRSRLIFVQNLHNSI